MPPEPLTVSGTLTWPVIVTVLGGILAPTIAVAVGAWLANRNAGRAAKAAVLVAKKAEVAADAVKVVAEKVAESNDSNSKKLDTIHGLVNSRLSTALAKIDALEQRLFDVAGVEPTGEPESEPPTSTSIPARSETHVPGHPTPAQEVAPPPVDEATRVALDAAEADANRARNEVDD